MTAAVLPGPAQPDPTVVSPEQLAEIQASLGISLQDTDPAIIRHVVDRSRAAGNEAFRQKNYKDAVRAYSQAIAGDAGDATLFGNRSAAYLALGLYEQAAWDARKAVGLRPGWPKAHYRLGCAYLALSQWAEAAAALQQAEDLEPGSSDVCAKLAAAKGRADAEVAARMAQAASERRTVTAQLRAARRSDQQLTMLNQFKQSMTGPEWELEDLEWRPTWLPAMRLKRVRPEAVLGDSRRRLLSSYLTALADLSHPKQALRTLEDGPRLQAFQRGISSALALQPPNAHVLVLSSGGGLLPLLAAEAGAGRVTAVERSRMLFRMAKQVLESNSGGGSRGELAQRVKLVDRSLQAIGVQGEAPPPDAHLAAQERAALAAAAAAVAAGQPPTAGAAGDGEGGGNGPNTILTTASAAAGAAASRQLAAALAAVDAADAAALLPARASLLVTDLLDHAVLGMGLLPAVDYAAVRLLAPGALVVPQRVAVYGCLVEFQVDRVSGFDLSALNAYWWHPGAERLELSRLPHRRLSAPFLVHNLDLQARVDARMACRRAAGGAAEGGATASGSSDCGKEGSGKGSNIGGDSSGGGGGDVPSGNSAPSDWELDTTLEVAVTADGRWNAVVFWFEVHTECGAGVIGSTTHGSTTTHGTDSTAESSVDGTSSSSGSSSSRAALTSWAVGSASIPRSSGTGSSCSSSIESGGSGTGAALPEAARSWDQAVQYVDPQAVIRGSTVPLRVRQDAGQYVFTSSPPQCRPRHALVPRWHFDMVMDRQRNDAYDGAIRRAVARKKAAGCGPLLALDIGAGTGLLSMMAARAGADEVYAAEISGHMCDVGEEACIANGFLGSIVMLDRDSRRLDVMRKPDGTPPDMPRRADLLVYEVFDSGCIGEGVLHLLASAQAKLLAPGAAMVPQAARVFCQPIQMRVGTVLGWDCGQANRWRWRADYEGVELGKCRDRWVPLGPPLLAFDFDFHMAAAHMAPAQQLLQLAFDREGVFNAVAMWFELDLDEESTLSTCPYSNKGLTWQQAVQWVPEVAVRPGQTLQLTAAHDTYSISYRHSLPAEPAVVATRASATQAPTFAEETEQAEQAQQDTLALPQEDEQAHPCRTAVPVVDPAWQASFDRLQGLNGELAKACVQNPLEYRAVAQAALQFAARPHDLGLDCQQALEFCVKMMG